MEEEEKEKLLFVVFTETNEVDAMVKREFVVGLLDLVARCRSFFLLTTNE